MRKDQSQRGSILLERTLRGAVITLGFEGGRNDST
jgi:hypothetical protein